MSIDPVRVEKGMTGYSYNHPVGIYKWTAHHAYFSSQNKSGEIKLEKCKTVEIVVRGI